MADNTTLNAGSGGDTIRDVNKSGSIKTPVCILDVGGAGAESLLAVGQQAKAASLPVTIASDQGALPTVATLDAVYNGTSSLTVQRVAINLSASGDTVVIAAVAGQRVHVLRWLVIVGGSTSLTFKDGTTALTGPMPLVANQPLSGAEGDLSHFVTTAGNGLTLNSSSAVQVSGYLLYVQF